MKYLHDLQFDNLIFFGNSVCTLDYRQADFYKSLNIQNRKRVFRLFFQMLCHFYLYSLYNMLNQLFLYLTFLLCFGFHQKHFAYMQFQYKQLFQLLKKSKNLSLYIFGVQKLVLESNRLLLFSFVISLSKLNMI